MKCSLYDFEYEGVSHDRGGTWPEYLVELDGYDQGVVYFEQGLVQLDDVIRVEGRLTENDPAKLEFGQEVELTMVPFTTDEDGTEVMTFAFQPA